jgi:hypothetical protein
LKASQQPTNSNIINHQTHTEPPHLTANDTNTQHKSNNNTTQTTNTYHTTNNTTPKFSNDAERIMVRGMCDRIHADVRDNRQRIELHRVTTKHRTFCHSTVLMPAMSASCICLMN